jgi:hypothetical protein
MTFAMEAPEDASNARTVLLVDLGPEDSSLVSELYLRPGIVVKMVLASPSGNLAGASLTGVPLSRNLADLALETFDLALLGSRCARRPQIERVLSKSGTLVATLEEFVESELEQGRANTPHPEPPPSRSSGVMSTVQVRGNRPAPREEAPARPEPTSRPIVPLSNRSSSPSPSIGAHAREQDDGMPSPEDPAALEHALAEWVELNGAMSAELQGGDSESIQWVCRKGPPDPLLQNVILMALESGTPQVLRMAAGAQPHRVWAAWPFRTGFRSGLLAVSGIEPDLDCDRWEQIVKRLSQSWEHRDREKAGASFPMVPGAPTGWLGRPAFRHRVSLAIERNRRDGLRFAVHRVALDGATECVESLSRVLPQKLRDTDCVCRPSPGSMLLLIAGSPNTAAHVWKRIGALWDECWQTHGGEPPAPPLDVESIELATPSDAEIFMETASEWLSD